MGHIYTMSDFDFAHVKPGDHVSQEVVTYFVNCLIPACMRKDCTQLGEPYADKFDPDTGRLRPTYATFRHVNSDAEEDVWQFCGYCFRGENTERGKMPVYC